MFLPHTCSDQPSSRRRISASQRCPSLLTRLTRPPTRTSQRSGAARSRPSATEPAGRPHPDERTGRRHAERRRAEPRLAGLALHGVPRRRPAQHRLLLLILQSLHHGGRSYAAGLPVSAATATPLTGVCKVEMKCVCVFSQPSGRLVSLQSRSAEPQRRTRQSSTGRSRKAPGHTGNGASRRQVQIWSLLSNFNEIGSPSPPARNV